MKVEVVIMDGMNLDSMFGNDGFDMGNISEPNGNVSADNAGTSEPEQEANVQPVADSAASIPNAPTNAPTNAPAVSGNTQVSNNTVPDDFIIDMPAELQKSMEDMGIVVGDIGVKVNKVPIEKYKASTSKVDRIGFLSKKVIAVKFHYIEGAGSIMCFGGKCCDIGGAPQVRYLFPIAVYSTDSDGNITGSKVELKVLSAGQDLYKSIMTVNKGTEQYGGIDHADLLVTCTDDTYQKITLTFAGPAVWRQYAPIANFLKERWQKDGANAYMAVARKCDEAAFNKLVGLDDSDDSSIPSTFDASQSQDLSKFFD